MMNRETKLEENEELLLLKVDIATTKRFIYIVLMIHSKRKWSLRLNHDHNILKDF